MGAAASPPSPPHSNDQTSITQESLVRRIGGRAWRGWHSRRAGRIFCPIPEPPHDTTSNRRRDGILSPPFQTVSVYHKIRFWVQDDNHFSGSTQMSDSVLRGLIRVERKFLGDSIPFCLGRQLKLPVLKVSHISSPTITMLHIRILVCPRLLTVRFIL